MMRKRLDTLDIPVYVIYSLRLSYKCTTIVVDLVNLHLNVKLYTVFQKKVHL